MLSIPRLVGILKSPRAEWALIEPESASTGSIVSGWLVWLAAIPAIATFIGMSLVGIGGFGVTIRVPILSGLVSAVVGWVLSIVMVLVMAKIADVLAPKFGGRSDYVSALKLMAYGSTAGMVAGIASLLPLLSILGLLGGLYSIYTVWIGAPTMMKVPAERNTTYVVVLILCGIVAGIVMAMVSHLFTPSPAKMAGGDVRISTPGGSVKVDTGKLEEAARKMEEAARKVEEASKSGDPAAIGKAATEAMGAMASAAGGGAPRAPIGIDALKRAMPNAIDGLKRGDIEAENSEVMGIKTSRARAEFGAGERRLTLEITDPGSMAGMAAMAGWAMATGERDTADARERTWKQDGRVFHERQDKTSRNAEFKVVLANGVIVEADGEGIDASALRRAVEAMDLRGLERANTPG